MYQLYHQSLNGQITRFSTFFFLQKTPPGPHMNMQKQFCEIFCFLEDNREKCVSAQSLTILTWRQHSLDYADKMLSWLLNTLTTCQFSHRLRGHMSA